MKNINLENLGQIKDVVENHFNVTLWREKGKRGNNRTCDAKKTYCLLAKEILPCTLNEIGFLLNKDHACVLNLISRGRNHLDCEKEFASNYDQCLKKLPKSFEKLRIMKTISLKKKQRDDLYQTCQNINKEIKKLDIALDFLKKEKSQIKMK